MKSNFSRTLLSLAVIIFLCSCTSPGGHTPTPTIVVPTVNVPTTTPSGGTPAGETTGVLYNQPVDINGTLLLSSWLDPDGSDYDQYIWDNFSLSSDATITEIDWFGVYDPTKFGAGGPVADFRVSIYPSIAAGTEPDVANPPLAQYRSGGNAEESAIGSADGGTMYSYTLHLPTPFSASKGTKYWLQIEASQHGSVPDWCLVAGTSGNGSHYQRGAGAGGDILYRSAPGDAAISLLGPVPVTPTP